MSKLDVSAGKREMLAALIKQAYGISEEQAERRVASWQEAQK